MIDVVELICELHKIANDDSVDASIRKTACDAKSALGSLTAWVNELQMDAADMDGLYRAIDYFAARERVGGCEGYHAANLRRLRDRHCATSTRDSHE